ncbi:MAG: integration host factor subunit beta [Syntrophales bacterium]|nr:integration host factor subunit beta [Syntrophales bacterium]
MTKNELVQQVQNRLKDQSAKDVAFAVNIVFAAMAKALGRGERIDMRGFGNFTIRCRRARVARNPQNGASIQLAARRVPFFKVSVELLKRMNSPE